MDRGVEEFEQLCGQDVQDVQQCVEHNLGAAQHGVGQDRGEAGEQVDEAEAGCLLDQQTQLLECASEGVLLVLQRLLQRIEDAGRGGCGGCVVCEALATLP